MDSVFSLSERVFCSVFKWSCVFCLTGVQLVWIEHEVLSHDLMTNAGYRVKPVFVRSHGNLTLVVLYSLLTKQLLRWHQYSGIVDRCLYDVSGNTFAEYFGVEVALDCSKPQIVSPIAHFSCSWQLSRSRHYTLNETSVQTQTKRNVIIEAPKGTQHLIYLYAVVSWSKPANTLE